MFLSKVELAPRASESSSFWGEVSTPYGSHQALWRLFGRSPDQPRDFLYRQELGARGLQFLVLSAAPPPQASPLWQVQTKSFDPRLSRGQRLVFRLRASPVVRRRGAQEGGGIGRSKRHDVVMDLKRSQRQRGEPLDAPQRLAELAGLKWLASQGDRAGFRLVMADSEELGEDGLLEATSAVWPAVRVDGYQQHRLRRREAGSDLRDIRFSSLDFEGQLEVVDPDLLVRRIGEGIGPQKAFGCGLMLLRRV